MQIEINGEAEHLIRAAMASGKYASVDEFIATMAKNSQITGNQNAVREAYEVQSAVAGTSGWDDPEMAKYDHYDAFKNPS